VRLVLDWDGTVTERDTLDLVLEEFGDKEIYERVEGDVALDGDPLVVELWPEASIAAGEAQHGLGELLGAETIRLREGDALPPLGDSTRTLVLVLRDAHRHAWQRELVMPSAVVVETGVPAWRPDGVRAYLATYGAGRANLAAAAEALRS
jgi:beta-N-acetylhexosaminidase